MALCSKTKSSEQQLEAMNWWFGGKHCRSVKFLDDTAGNQAGKYWDVNVLNGDSFDATTKVYAELKYLFWLDNGVVSDPVPGPGQTLFPIPYTNGDTAEDIADAMITAVEADVTLNKLLKVALMTDALDTVEYQNKFMGEVTTEVTSGATGLTFAIGSAGYGGYLGQVASGGSTLTIEHTFLEVTADQTGPTVLDELLQGTNCTVAMTLAEMTKTRWKNIVGKVFGDFVTPSVDNDVIGYGTSKLFKSSFDVVGYLVGHPIRLPASDRSMDVSILTAPKLASINFSGTDIQGAECEFKAYLDSSMDAKVNLLRFGDYSLL